MKLIKLNQAYVSGEGKLIPLGRMYLNPEEIICFYNNITSDHKIMKDGSSVIVRGVGALTVLETVEEVKEELEQQL